MACIWSYMEYNSKLQYVCVCVCVCERERERERKRECERDLCALTLMYLKKSKYAPQLTELHGVNNKKRSVFMHLLPFDGEKYGWPMCEMLVFS